MGWGEHETADSIAARFRSLAARHADEPAVAGGAHRLTYGELDALSDKVAAALQPRCSNTRRVALLAEGDRDLLAAVLGALKAGAAVVTLNPGDPPARLAAVCRQVRPDVVAASPEHLAAASAARLGEAALVDLSTLPSGVDGPGAAARPDDPAFLISTSGSTGTPKIVVQTHRNVLHNVLRYTNGLGVRQDDRLALLVSLGGGQGIATLWTGLLNGCTLCSFPIASRGVTGLFDWLAANEITVLDAIPSVLRNFAVALRGKRIGSVRLVRLASEAASRNDFDAYARHFPADSRLASVLASSECGIIAQGLYSPEHELAGARLPVGQPAEGVDVALVDADGAPVAEGEVGEIVVESRYLSPGYLGDDALTAARFETVDGVRRFRSGDRGRRDGRGALTVVGRDDAQVKIRGHRLQLEEVEAALACHPSVAAAAVVVVTSSRGDANLAAFVLPARGVAPSPSVLRRFLHRVLPAHAVPSTFAAVDALPVTSHGKIDRARLAAGAAEPPVPPAGSPQTETEELVADLWALALERAEIGRDAGFLDLGGDSLDAATIAAGIDELFGVGLDLGVFAGNPTVATLSAEVERRRGAGATDSAAPLRRTARPGPLSYSQERFWRQADERGSDTVWNVVVPFRITGPLDVGALRRSLEQLTMRHEILRTGYVQDGEVLRAVVRDAARVELAIEDLSGEPDHETAVGRVVDAERRRPFDLARDALLRVRLLRLGHDEYRLVRSSHHMIHDAASWRIFFDELALLYEAALDRRPPPLPLEPPFQYIDVAAWERASVQSGSRRHVDEVEWWQNELATPPRPSRLAFERAEIDHAADRSQDLVRWGLPSPCSDVLNRTARAVGATFFMSRLALFAALLAADAGVEELLVGTPFSTRTRPELRQMIGPFINFRPLRLRVSAGDTVTGLLGAVRETVLHASARSDLPWEVLADELRRRDVALVPVSASFAAWSSVGPMQFGGIRLEPLPRPCGESRGFRIGVNRLYEEDRCWADFDPRRYDATGVERFVRRLERFSSLVCEHPSAPLDELHSQVPG